MTTNRSVIVSGSFDDLRSRHIRLLEEASKLGRLQVLLWSDASCESAGGRPPKFPQAERHYLIQAVRYVAEVRLVTGPLDPDRLPASSGNAADTWVVDQRDDTPAKRTFCHSQGRPYHVLTDDSLAGFPVPAPEPPTPGRKKVIVTGCFDWFHSGHVRFFEEVAQLGDLYVVVGHDANIRQLKGEGHPLFAEAERRYLVGATRYVKQALLSSGTGWMDAEPEIARLQPDIYAVNEDGDKPEKREFCRTHGLQYAVLKRTPRAGLTQRSSTHLRGF